MNNERRKEIRKICDQIENLVGKLDDILFEEQDSYENMIGDERKEASEEAQDCIEAAKDSLSEAVESLEEVL